MKFKSIILSLVCLMACGIQEVAAQSFAQQGIASYYAHKFHGRRTSSGEIFDMNKMTCAHRTLPFGTLLKVEDVKTGKSVVVRVTDRGPFSKGRVIDLSLAAAKELGIVARGTAQVRLSVVGKGGIEKGNSLKTSKPAAKPAAKQPATTQPERRGYEVKVLDTETGEYCTKAEWDAKHPAANIPTDAEGKPRYRIVNAKVTAKAGK